MQILALSQSMLKREPSNHKLKEWIKNLLFLKITRDNLKIQIMKEVFLNNNS